MLVVRPHRPGKARLPDRFSVFQAYLRVLNCIADTIHLDGAGMQRKAHLRHAQQVVGGDLHVWPHLRQLVRARHVLVEHLRGKRARNSEPAGLQRKEIRTSTAEVSLLCAQR